MIISASYLARNLNMVVKISIFGILLCAIIIGRDQALCSSVIGSIDPLVHRYIRDTNHLDKDSYKAAQLIKANSNSTAAVEFATMTFELLARLENNLLNVGLELENGSPAHSSMLFSKADNTALSISKAAYINAKASTYILNDSCRKYGILPSICAQELKNIFKQISTSDIKCKISKYRTPDGYCNNQKYPTWGSTYTPYARLLPAKYKDGIWDINDLTTHDPLPTKMDTDADNKVGVEDAKSTLAVAVWANLVAYDMAHTVSYRMMHNGGDIICCSKDNKKLAPRYRHPLCLQVFDKDINCLNYVRSMLSKPFDQEFGPAEQMNAATHFLDGSTIYGSNWEISKSLRLNNKGQLKTLTTNCDHNQPCAVGGDIRPNLDPITMVMHVVFIREHNRLATILSEINPHWDDETLYQEARRIVIAEIQHITYNEWLPLLIGNIQASDSKYDVDVDPSVYNSFANSAMQFAISLFGDELSLYDESRSVVSNIPMKYSSVSPDILTANQMMDSLMLTLATQRSKASDLNFPDGLTKFVNNEKKQEALNLLNVIIQRERDHGLNSYTSYRNLFARHNEHFLDSTGDIPSHTLKTLQHQYSNIDKINLFIGGMAEEPIKGALLGPTFATIINKQMILTRTADQYFYDNSQQAYPFTSEQLNEIQKSSLARLLCDNSDQIKTMQPNAFQMFNLKKNKLVSCKEETEIKQINLRYWKQ